MTGLYIYLANLFCFLYFYMAPWKSTLVKGHHVVVVVVVVVVISYCMRFFALPFLQMATILRLNSR